MRINGKVLLVSAVPLLFGLSVFGLSATVANAETVTLDLPQAIERANNFDPRITEKEKLMGVAQGLMDEAVGAKSWIYDINAFAAFAPKTKGGVTTDGQGNLVIPEDALDFDGISPWYNVQFRVVRPLYTFGKVAHYTDAAKNNIRISEGNVQLERANTYIDVVRAYNGFLAARDARKILEDAEKKAKSALELVQKWLDEGEGEAKQSDLFALQTGTALIKRFAGEARGIENVAAAGLKMLVGLGSGDELLLADQGIKPVALPEQSLEELQKMALAQRPEIMQVEAGLMARRALVSAKKAETYPNVYGGVVGSVAMSPGRDRDELTQSYDPFNHAGLTPIIGVKWDLFSGRQKGQIAQAEAEYNALIEKKSFARIGIPFQVAEQYHLMHANHQMVKDLYDGAISGRRWLISTYADFEAALDTSSSLVTAFQGYMVAYTDYYRAVNNYNLNVARLQVVTGEIK